MPAEQFSALKAAFDSQTAQLRKRVENTKKRLENLFVFVENAFVEGNEMLILVTELTVRSDCARFIGQFGCEAYHRHSQELIRTQQRPVGGGCLPESGGDELKWDWKRKRKYREEG